MHSFHPLCQQRPYHVWSARLRFAVVLMLFSLFIAPVPASATGNIRYVISSGGQTNGNCGNWGNACELNYAFGQASSGDVLWIATGTYTPTARTDSADPRSATFILTDSVAIYGGFAGSETALSQRNWGTNVVTLSGDLGASGDKNDNSYHVVIGANNATLDGVTISDGNANGSGSNSNGGGMLNIGSSPVLSNVTFSGNQANTNGGGMANGNSSNPSLTNVTFSGNQAESGGGMANNGSSSPVLNNVTFRDNSAAFSGGGMWNVSNSNPTLTNVTFSGNQTTGHNTPYDNGGGGMYNWLSRSMLTNVVFSGNSANKGGGLFNIESSPTLTNVTFSGNRATGDNNSTESKGGGIYNTYNSHPSIRNSIIWGNTASTGTVMYNNPSSQFSSSPDISTSLVEGSFNGGSWDSTLGSNGGGNRATDPLFVNVIAATSAPTTTGNYRLQAASPAINVGANAVITTTTDVAGHLRVVGGTVDLGAYEVPFPSVLSLTRAGSSPTNAATVSFTVTFNMPVTGVDSSDFTLTKTDGQSGATFGAFSNGLATTWLVAVTTVDNVTGTIKLDVVDNDSIVTGDTPPVPLGGIGIGNGAFTSSDEMYIVDRIAPTVVFSTTVAEPTNASTIPVTVTFSREVTGFDQTDLAVTNAALSAFTPVSGTVHTFILTPQADGLVTVNLAANKVQDVVVGNGNRAAPQLSRTYDHTAPTAVLSTPFVNFTNSSPIPVTVTFSEVVTGFDVSDLAAGNATINEFNGNGSSYTFNLTPLVEGVVTATLAAEGAVDAANNLNLAATISRVYDHTPPTVTLLNPPVITLANVTNYPVGGTCTTGDGDVTVQVGGVQGTATCATGSFAMTLNVSALSDGDPIAVSARQTDAASNLGSANATTRKDATAPTAVFSSSLAERTNASTIPVTVTFSEAVTDFTQSDLSVTNATVATFTLVSTTVATFTLIPQDNGLVTVDLPVGATVDAVGNGNSAAPQFRRTYDTTAPTVILSSSVSDPTNANPLTVTITFDELVTGFEATDLTLGNVTLSSFTGSGSTYTVTLTPQNQGLVTVDVAANVVLDGVGLPNTAASQFRRTYDSVAPALTLTTPPVIALANVTSYPVGGRCTTGDGTVTVQVGSVQATTACTTGSFATTLTVSALSDGGSIAVSARQTDAAGNLGSASATTRKDTTAPTVAFSSPVAEPTRVSSIPVTVTFSEAVTGFDVQRLVVTNATVSAFTLVSEPVYTFILTPVSNGVVTVALADGAVLDAAGNGNTAAPQFRRTYAPRTQVYLPLLRR